MAAHAATTKATSAHHAQGAAHAAVSGSEAALFANLLAKTGKADDSDGQANDNIVKSANPEDILAALMKKKSGKSQTGADDLAANLAQAQATPAQLAALNAKVDTADSKTTGDKAGKDSASPVGAVDDATKSANAVQPSRADKDDAQSASKAAKQAASDTLLKNAADIAAAGATKTSGTAKAKDRVAATDPARLTEAAKNGTSPQDIKTATGDGSQAKPSDTAKAPGDKADNAKDAKKDASDPATTADKATALAAAADHNVRQAAASQGTQARALPVHLQAQVTAGPSGGKNQTGGDTKDSAQDHAQNAKNDTASQPQPDAAKPAADAPLNTAGATPPVSHASTQTANVQPLTAQTQTPAITTVAASLQVAPQTANQAAALPDMTALAVQIAMKSSEGSKQFDIRLDPPELGRVDVKLSFDNDGRAQAHLTVEKPQTLDLMQRDRSDLQRALKDSGVDLSQNGLNFSLKGQERQGDNSAPFRGRSRSLAATAAIETVSAAVAASTNSYAAGDARLDIRV